MTSLTNTRIILQSRPEGRPSPDNFRLETVAVPEPQEGQVLLKIRYLSLDPYMRGRMSEGKSYVEPIALGHVMEGEAVAEVVSSRHADYAAGDMVVVFTGWQTFAVADADGLRKIDPAIAPVTTALGVLGMPGFTAYAGLLTIGQPKAGETVVVAAASGPVGSAVGQIAKLNGARTVGIAGGEKKCRALIEEFGFDVALDHYSPDFASQLQTACPSGIDVYFENVGGKVLEAVFPLLNTYARVPVCGLIAQYNSSGVFDGPDRLPLFLRDVLSKSLTIRGFIQREFSDQRPAFYQAMAQWIAEGKVNYREDIVEGLANTPEAFIGLLEGKNFGKLIVEVS